MEVRLICALYDVYDIFQLKTNQTKSTVARAPNYRVSAYFLYYTQAKGNPATSANNRSNDQLSSFHVLSSKSGSNGTVTNVGLVQIYLFPSVKKQR